MKLASTFLALAAAVGLCAPIAYAQTAPAPAKTTPDSASVKPSAEATPSKRVACTSDQSDLAFRTFYLNNVVQPSDANEIVTALRNMLDPCDKTYLVADQSAIVMQANPNQLALAQKLINDLDRPKKTYRLTYTVTELDSGKVVGTQHFAMVVVSGQQSQLKQGSKVPIATGSYSAGGVSTGTNGSVQTQFTYFDLGMNFSATLDEFANGVRLNTTVEQFSLAEETSGVGTQDPVIRDTSLKSAAFLTPGKPLQLGSVDIPGSTRHLDVEVVMEQLP